MHIEGLETLICLIEFIISITSCIMWRVLHFHHLIANEASFYVTIDCPLKGGVETYLSTFSYVIRDRPPACEADPSTPHRKYNFQLPNSEEVSAYMHILSCTYDGGWTSRWAITISTNHTYLVVLTMGGGRYGGRSPSAPITHT